MIRLVAYLLLSILLITFLRSVIGIIGKAFADLLRPAPPAAPPHTGADADSVARELKRDPVCGTYVPETTSVKKTVGGEVFHFCSQACRDKYPDA